MEKEEKIKVLQDLIHIKTTNGNELEVAEYLADLLGKHGIDSKIFPFGDGRANLIAEIGTGKSDKVLAFEGHQDTVAVSHEDDWKYPPYSATIVGDKLYGRGAADMKSGLAAEVIALIELVDAGKIPEGTVRLIATAGEEFGAPGAYKIENQYIDDIDAMVVGEPTDGDVTYAHSGCLNYEIISEGVPAHSSTPEKGVNAISGLIEFINAEPELFADLPSDDILGDVQHSITVINGGDQVNTIPGAARLMGNVRPTLTFGNKKVIALLKDAVTKVNQETDYDLEFNLVHNFYPVETAKDEQFVRDAYEIAKRDYKGKDVQLIIDNGATDASVYVQENDTMAVILLGPDRNDTSHKINEYTTVSSYLDTIEAFEGIVGEYFG